MLNTGITRKEIPFNLQKISKHIWMSFSLNEYFIDLFCSFFHNANSSRIKSQNTQPTNFLKKFDFWSFLCYKISHNNNFFFLKHNKKIISIKAYNVPCTWQNNIHYTYLYILYITYKNNFLTIDSNKNK